MMNIRTCRMALTLVELLVTLAVVSALAALVLPSVKTMLTDRKGSQSAIMVKNYLEMARSRAIAKGRPVAVILERISSRGLDSDENGRLEGAEIGVSGTANPVGASTDPVINYVTYNACIRLSLAEAPVPITSDVLGMDQFVSGSLIQTVQNLPSIYPQFTKVRIYTQNGSVALPHKDGVDVLLQEDTSFSQPRPPRVPLEVSFGNSPVKLSVARVERAGDGSFWDLYFVRNDTAFNSTELVNAPYDPRVQGLFPVTFYPMPKPIAFQNIELPKGQCVDLSISGFLTNRHPMDRDSNAPNDGDYRLRFSSDWVSPLVISPTPGSVTKLPEPFQLRPVYIVFNPDGTFGRVYANHECPFPAPSNGPPSSFEPIDAVEDIFWHIGKIDQLLIDPSNAALPFQGNLIDSSSYIVRVSPTSGAITAGPTGSIRRSEDLASGLIPQRWSTDSMQRVSELGDFVELARRRAFAQTMSAQ
jgi:Tfp pilus assembly protein FimT